MRECDFCNEFVGGNDNAFAERYRRNPRYRVLSTTDGFRVLPSLGLIAEGHLLIASAPHHRAMADMSPESVTRLENLTRQVRAILSDTYGTCVFFEHGIRTSGSGGCGIDHAHLHAVPVSGTGILAALLQTFKGSRINRLGDIASAVPVDSSYLFFEDSAGERYVFAAPSIPSQYMRKLICDSIGKQDWDWRQSGREPELFSTLERLTPAFSKLVTPA